MDDKEKDEPNEDGIILLVFTSSVSNVADMYVEALVSVAPNYQDNLVFKYSFILLYYHRVSQI